MLFLITLLTSHWKDKGRIKYSAWLRVKQHSNKCCHSSAFLTETEESEEEDKENDKAEDDKENELAVEDKVRLLSSDVGALKRNVCLNVT